MKMISSYSIILMGVAGAGKTTIGKKLEKIFGYKFYDADDFHPTENIKKMRKGIPLTDDDRLGWLENLNNLLADSEQKLEPIVLACSSLKEKYRCILTENTKCVFIYLKISKNCAINRLENRVGHYFNASLIDAQFDDLEEPEICVEIDADKSIPEIIRKIKLEMKTP
ncbi:MAG TPA: gluconokinase [Victivallales bacterium]|nr:gluconokinase [Victivallales bacterium]